MSEPEENQQHQQFSDYPALGYEASHEERRSLEIEEEERNTSVAEKEEKRTTILFHS